MNLYKDVVVRSEEPADPDHTVDRVQSISAAVFHLEQVNTCAHISTQDINNKDKRIKMNYEWVPNVWQKQIF